MLNFKKFIVQENQKVNEIDELDKELFKHLQRYMYITDIYEEIQDFYNIYEKTKKTGGYGLNSESILRTLRKNSNKKLEFPLSSIDGVVAKEIKFSEILKDLKGIKHAKQDDFEITIPVGNKVFIDYDKRKSYSLREKPVLLFKVTEPTLNPLWDQLYKLIIHVQYSILDLVTINNAVYLKFTGFSQFPQILDHLDFNSGKAMKKFFNIMNLDFEEAFWRYAKLSKKEEYEIMHIDFLQRILDHLGSQIMDVNSYSNSFYEFFKTASANWYDYADAIYNTILQRIQNNPVFKTKDRMEFQAALIQEFINIFKDFVNDVG